MATARLIGKLGGFIRGYASGNALPNVTYKLPPAPYGWAGRVVGDTSVTFSWVDLSTGQSVFSHTGNSNYTGNRTSADTEAQQLATTVGIGVRFTGASSIYTVGIAPIGPDGDAYAMPPT